MFYWMLNVSCFLSHLINSTKRINTSVIAKNSSSVFFKYQIWDTHSIKYINFSSSSRARKIVFKLIYILVKQTTLRCCNIVEYMVVTNLVMCISLICIHYSPQTYNYHTYILKNFPSQYLLICHTCSPLDWTILCNSN